jgi:hypothetical protein
MPEPIADLMCRLPRHIYLHVKSTFGRATSDLSRLEDLCGILTQTGPDLERIYGIQTGPDLQQFSRTSAAHH